MNNKGSNRFYIRGYIDFPSDQFAKLKSDWETHVDLSRQEEGCISFEYTYDAQRTGRVHISEIYTDEAAFEAHKARAMQAGWVELSKDAERHFEMSDTPFA